jgi:hypothetical protein
LLSDETEKRSNAMCLASFDNEVRRQKGTARWKLYFVTVP